MGGRSGPGLEPAFALELAYHRSLSRDTLVQASLEEMYRLAPENVTPQRRAAWSQAMQQAFVDVRPGMRITGLYIPGQGCRFYVDGKLSRAVADPVLHGRSSPSGSIHGPGINNCVSVCWGMP